MTAPSPKVRLRCGIGSCRQTLLELFDEPTDWTGGLNVPGCPRHDTFNRQWWDEVARRRAKGLSEKPEVTLLTVAWADLRHAFYLADTLGKTTEETLRRV